MTTMTVTGGVSMAAAATALIFSIRHRGLAATGAAPPSPACSAHGPAAGGAR